MGDFSKDAQVSRSPGGNRRCPATGEFKRSCDCFSCRGRRNRRKGKDKQRAARKHLEKSFGPAGRSSAQTGDEENWRMRVRSEVKAGGKAKTVDTFYRNTRAQSDANAKAVGDVRPFVAVAMPDGLSYGYVVIRTDELDAVMEAGRR